MHSLKRQVEDTDKLGGKLEEDEVQTIKDATGDGIQWLKDNADAASDEIKEQQKEVEKKVSKIIEKLYATSGSASKEEDHDEL